MKDKAVLTKASMIMLGFMLTACNSSTETEDSSITFPVVDTGQELCYDDEGKYDESTGVNYIDCPVEGEDFYGQDAQFGENGDAFDLEYLTDDDGVAIYTTQSYDNGDYEDGYAVIIDNNTGLMWEGTPSNVRWTYEEAEAYVESLNTMENDDGSIGFQGYTDWRMPTMKELYSIADFSEGWPYLDMDYFTLPTYVENDGDPLDTQAKDEQYWTELYVGNTYEAGNAGGFGLNHGTGHIKVYPATTDGDMGKAVRAVRGTEDVYGVNAFELNESDDGNTVTDSATGLMWTQDDSAAGDLLEELNRLIDAGLVVIGDDVSNGSVGVIGLLNWEDALAFAENAEFGGYDDWRLPSIKELQTIIDYEHSPTAGFYRYSDTSSDSDDDSSEVTSSESTSLDESLFDDVEDADLLTAIDALGDGETLAFEYLDGLSDEQLSALETAGYIPAASDAGGPSGSSDVSYVWYDACDAEVVAANGQDAVTDADECDARGPAIDSDYFVATTLNSILDAGIISTSDALYAMYNNVTVQQGLSDYGYYWSSTSTRYGTEDEDLLDHAEDETTDGDGYRDTDYAFAWYTSVGSAVNESGEDYHGAGAIRYDVKDENSDAEGEDAERVFNLVRLVRDAD